MNVAKKILDLAELHVGRFEYLWGASEVIHNCDGENLEGHHLLNVLLSALIFVGGLEFWYSVIIFVSKFPPVRAQLTNNADVILLKSFSQRAQFIIDFNKVVKVKLDIFKLELVARAALVGVRVLSSWSRSSVSLWCAVDTGHTRSSVIIFSVSILSDRF